MTDLDPFTARVLTSVANTAERAGGSFIVQLPDHRYITVIVIHEDPQPPAQTPPQPDQCSHPNHGNPDHDCTPFRDNDGDDQ